jgi:hypothetical protein
VSIFGLAFAAAVLLLLDAILVEVEYVIASQILNVHPKVSMMFVGVVVPCSRETLVS